MMTAVVVIAVLAVVARVIINRQQKGGINWLKIGSLLGLAVVFVVSMLTFDAYRAETWLLGPVSSDDLKGSATHIVGREASEAVPTLDGLEGRVVPMYFALTADSVAPTGYWRKRRDEQSIPDRQELVSQSDSSRTAVKRTLRGFGITRTPDNEDDYVRIYRLAMPGGAKVLALMTDYDAHSGVTPVGTTAPLEGKMAQIAAKDTTLNQNVYVSFYDRGHYTHGRYLLMVYSALFSIVVTAIVGLVGFAIYRIARKKRTE